MTFQKIVKAPAKRAHIGNYPHKKSEARIQRKAWLLNHLRTLIGAMLVMGSEFKTEYYLILREAERELKEMGSYDEWAIRELVITAKHEHNRRRMGFF